MSSRMTDNESQNVNANHLAQIGQLTNQICDLSVDTIASIGVQISTWPKRAFG